MEEAGLHQVQAAKSDGRWNSAYAPQGEMEIPADFIAALESNPDAKKFFDTLNKINRYAISYRLATAKKPETRSKRFDQFLQMMENGEKFH
jgi:uncharacterized protein YdeI (YjbR/CyaY-like superfamily)